jgi:hypothetical protein
MHLQKQVCSRKLAESLGLDLRHVGGEVLFNSRARTALVVTVTSIGRGETRTERTLISRGEEYLVTEQGSHPFGRQPRWTFTVNSLRRLTSSDTSRLRQFAETALALHLPSERLKRFVVKVVDKTRPPRPVPLSVLRKALKNYCELLTKDMCLSHSIDFVIPTLVSREDAPRLHAHIQASNGRDFSIVELLVFRLAYERDQLWSKTAKHEPDAKVPA